MVSEEPPRGCCGSLRDGECEGLCVRGATRRRWRVSHASPPESFGVQGKGRVLGGEKREKEKTSPTLPSDTHVQSTSRRSAET